MYINTRLESDTDGVTRYVVESISNVIHESSYRTFMQEDLGDVSPIEGSVIVDTDSVITCEESELSSSNRLALKETELVACIRSNYSINIRIKKLYDVIKILADAALIEDTLFNEIHSFLSEISAEFEANGPDADFSAFYPE